MEIKLMKDGKVAFEGGYREAVAFVEACLKRCYEHGTEEHGFVLCVDGKEACELSIVSGEMASPRGYAVAMRMVETSEELPAELYDLENACYMDPEDAEAFR